MGSNPEYSDLPNNGAANLIIFQGKNTYTTLLGPTILLISEIFPSKPDFHLYKWEKIPTLLFGRLEYILKSFLL